MNFLRLTAISLAAIVSSAGCDRDGPAPPAAPPTPASAAPAAPAASAPPAGAYSEHTGILDEEGFKKLHALQPRAAPARKGVTVSIGEGRAYLSLPVSAKPPLPAVIVIHEWWGLNEHVMHWADRLAADGYAALAVDLFGGQVATTSDRAMQLIKSVEADKAKAALISAHDFVEKDERVEATSTGVVGWCFGGKWAVELAIAEPDLDATVAYYGHVTTDVAQLKKIRSPVLAVFGNRDASIPASHVDGFEKALTQAGVKQRVLRYDADHAFANPSGARYDEKAATAAWKESRAFLAQHLKR